MTAPTTETPRTLPPHRSDALVKHVAEVLAAAGLPSEPTATRRAVRRWWAVSRPNGVPLGYTLGHFLPLDHDTATTLDALGAEHAEEVVAHG